MNESPALDRIESVFHAALSRSDLKTRECYLAETCAGDTELEAAVKRLLAADSGAESAFLGSPAVEFPAHSGRDVQLSHMNHEQAGDRFGNYRLVQEAGRGGFGVVWRAQQERPVRREVALKIIKPGMDTKEVIARFDQERQALALMDHPGIAKVLDAGATATGRPFFVMEMVSGVRITDFCDAHRLTTRERLTLFCHVCEAVQHAHQKGIIHRDLKPSNILVGMRDGRSVAKVIDFGVAKAIEQKLTELTLATRCEQMIGTPLYMSPEQAESGGLNLDTRSDVYSLGVLLCELLTGQTPFDLSEATLHDLAAARRMICEQEPRRPSTVLSTLKRVALAQIAAARQSEPLKLVGLLKGDLDWIVMKAVEKDRARRYDTATAFAGDIQRYLACEPVAARPPSQLYRFRKLVRRNKAAFAASAAVLAALLAGTAVSVWHAVRANAILGELRASAPAFVEQARALTEKQRFDEAIEKLDYALKLRPDVAEYHLAKARLFECQLRLREAAQSYRAALRIAPHDAAARASAELCERLLSTNADPQKLSRASLGELLAAMQKEQRPAAQLLPIARRLGEEKKLLFAHWSTRLKELPLPAEPPLDQRLTVREDGLLALDLSGTQVSDLRVLEGMPLGDLDCTGCARITDLAPLRGLPLRRLRVGGTGITGISPLESLGSLEELDLAETKITNLQPLQKLPLKILELRRLPIFSLSAVHGLRLEELGISETRITDLAALKEMPLRRLNADSIAAVNFTPLRGLPLEFCSLRRTRCYDLEFLRGMPLRDLFLSGAIVSNFEVLGALPSLEILALPDHFKTWSEAAFAGIPALRKHPQLRLLGVEESRAGAQTLLTSAAQFWQERDREAALLQPLRAAGMTVTLKVLPDRTWELSLDDQPVSSLDFLKGAPVSRLFLRNTKVTDLSPLAGMALKALSIRRTEIADLRPLAGMPLEELEITHTRVTDLLPLAGMSLKSLEIEETKISDLSPLRGMALQEFWMGTTQVSDLSPLRGMPMRAIEMDDCPNLEDLSPLLDLPTLEQIRLPKTARNIELLRALKNVKYIAFSNAVGLNRPAQTWEQFWSMRSPATEATLAKEERWIELERIVNDRLRNRETAEPWKDWLKLGTIALAQGDHPRYRALCAEMMGEMKDAWAGDTARMLFFAPDVGIDPAVLKRCMELAFPASMRPQKLGEHGEVGPWAALACGLGEYRAGRWSEAEKLLESVFFSEPPEFVADVISRAVLAMACCQQRDLAAAHRNLANACRALDTNSKLGKQDYEWHDWVIARLLVQEAETLLATEPKP